METWFVGGGTAAEKYLSKTSERNVDWRGGQVRKTERVQNIKERKGAMGGVRGCSKKGLSISDGDTLGKSL